MRPTLLLTLHRRYHELAQNLRATRALFHEFPAQPVVVLVWAEPEVGRLWFIQELLAQGLVDHVVGRPRLPDEVGGASTYPESHNLRRGLEFIREHFPACPWVVVQAADIEPRPGAYAFIASKFAAGEHAVVFHWENSCVQGGVWHTNFFAVCLDEQYWPPVSTPGHHDTLERQWGLHLQRLQPPGVFRWHNSGEQKFRHRHFSEQLPAWPRRPQSQAGNLPLSLRGLPWWCIPFEKILFKVRQWLNWFSSLTPWTKP